ncbi:MAG: SDR family oxidoreductase [Sphingomonadales bacterium]|nr:SDR family oxidoreductase [Sphingomonadales bacterium]
MSELAGKVVLVTGGAAGIGVGIAEVLAEAGASVVIADIDAAGAQAQAAALASRGHVADWLPLDLADEASIVACVAACVSRHGAPWGLVNNAGLQQRQFLLDGTAEFWDRTHDVNARGPFLLTREAARAMVSAGGGGRIVNIASAALIGSIINGLAVYTASKGALAGLGLAAAMELAPHGITVNTVLPGGVMTPGSMAAGDGNVPAEGPGRRRPALGMCEPRDIAAAVRFFVSPAARFVTNQTIAVDAGWSVS